MRAVTDESREVGGNEPTPQGAVRSAQGPETNENAAPDETAAQLTRTGQTPSVKKDGVRQIKRKLIVKPLFHQTDMTGIIHNAEYFRWFEEGRFQIMRELIAIDDSLCRGVVPLVVRNSCWYRRPVRFGDELVLITTHDVVEWYAGRLIFKHSLVDEKVKAESARGESEVTLFDVKANQLVKTWPKDVWERYQGLR